MTGGSLLRAVGLVIGSALLGLVVGLAAFQLTSAHARYLYLGPLCVTHDQQPGFDPWTGEPRGRTFYADCGPDYATTLEPHWIESDLPADLVGRHAIPLPVGWAVGSVSVLAVVAWRRRGPA